MCSEKRTVGLLFICVLVTFFVGCGIRSNISEDNAIEADSDTDKDDAGIQMGIGGSGATTGSTACGDGFIDYPYEQCDGLSMGGASCDTLGEGIGQLRCTPNCLFDVSGCRPAPQIFIPPSGSDDPTGTLIPNDRNGSSAYGDSPFSGADLGGLLDRLRDNQDNEDQEDDEESSSRFPRNR